MSSSKERSHSLKRVEDGKVPVEEGAQLSAALGPAGGSGASPEAGRGSTAGRSLRIRVTDIATGRPKATVQIPIGLVDAGMKIGARFAPEVEGVSMAQVLEAIRAGVTGKIIDVTDDRNGEQVEIFVE
jgi:hypothetical protein